MEIYNWGTNCEVCSYELGGEIEPTGDLVNDVEPEFQLFLEFETAWTPPIEAFEYLVENDPSIKVHLVYNEYGCGVHGCWSSD